MQLLTILISLQALFVIGNRDDIVDFFNRVLRCVQCLQQDPGEEIIFRELDDHTITLHSMLSKVHSREGPDGCFFWSRYVFVLIGLVTLELEEEIKKTAFLLFHLQPEMAFHVAHDRIYQLSNLTSARDSVLTGRELLFSIYID